MLYAALQHPAYRLRAPLRLKILEDDGTAVVMWEDEPIRTTGQTLRDALAAFRIAILEQVAAGRLGGYVASVH
jgi:hypothetical protein